MHKTPLGKVLGLGSAKHGSEHWWSQRVSAIALAPLGLWLVSSLVRLSHLDGLNYTVLSNWVSVPLNTMLLAATLVVLLYHSHLGVQVVLEDYATKGWSRTTALIIQKYLHVALGVIGIYSILKIAFGA